MGRDRGAILTAGVVDLRPVPAEHLRSPGREPERVAAERNAALRAAFAELPPRCQRLLAMLTSDPPSSYAEISETMQIPVGSIGPRRARCLERLRKSSALAGLSDADFPQGEGKHHA